MADSGLPEEEIKRCGKSFETQLGKDDERERDYLTYDELKMALEDALGTKFKRDNIFFKLVSELDNAEPNKITFNDFLTIYSKYFCD